MPKILTIDDELEFTNLIASYFGPRGYEVIVAHRGDEGLMLARREHPDVCLIDLKMPGLHGQEVLTGILTSEPKAKCIMITASEGEEKLRKNLISIGAFSCFDKPITSLKNLEEKVKEAIAS